MDSTSPDARPRSPGLGLNDILNVLWRHRLFWLALAGLGALAGVVYGLVVTPLHVATTTVQPGITNFNAQGMPVREWPIRDIVQWYQRGDFNPALAEHLDEDPRTFRPIIFAGFIPRGPQSRGGDTITLTTLSPEPQLAERMLNGSIDVFNSFAGSDTVFSGLHLIRVRIRANISKQQDKIAKVDAKRENIELQIVGSKADKEKLEASAALVEHEIAQLSGTRSLVEQSVEAYDATLANVDGTRRDLAAQLSEWESLREDLRTQRDELLQSGREADTVPLMLASNALGTLVGDIGQLQLGLLEQSDRVLAWQNQRRRLRMELSDLDQKIEAKEFERDLEIPRRALEIDQKIRQLELQRDYDLATEENDHRQEMRAMQSRLGSLTPLEQIGESASSARPVRPRRKRAILILTALGLASGIFLSFTLEYLSKNWREITRSTPAA